MGQQHRLPLGSWISQQAINRVCVLLFISTSIAVLFRFLWLDADDIYGCRGLLDHGRWLDASPLHHGRSFQNWQPPGCMAHKYDAADISSCLKSQNIVFIGDSTSREIFWALAKKLDPKEAVLQESIALKHEDQSFSRAGVTMRFIWDPFLNSSNLDMTLAAYQNTGVTRGEGSSASAGPTILLIGGGLWHAKHLGETYEAGFQMSIDNILNFIAPGDLESNSSSPIEFWKRPASSKFVAVAPVQIPYYEALNPSVQQSLSSTRIEALNSYLQKVSVRGIPVIWSYLLMTSHTDLAFDDKGVHVNDEVASWRADILLNKKCNEELMLSRSYPMDKTCCTHYPRINWLQATIVGGSLAILLLMNLSTNEKDTTNHLPLRKKGPTKLALPNPIIIFVSSKIYRAFSLLAFVLCYAFVADRTHVFNKAQKEYTSADFGLLCVIMLTLGVLSIRRTSPARKMADQSFLSRDQTDEWKGWMQFVILIYHYTGASKVHEIYALIRILVASYLYMTGFGHTVYFYRKGDYSLRRCAAVLLRLNLLSSILPYVMRTDYIFYYFAPLISFWYVVIYFTMKIGNTRNKSVRFLSTKIAISAALTTTLIRGPGIFEKIFLVLEKTCRIRWNVTEWRFRLQLDAYIVFFGMICGILFINISSALQDESNETKVFSLIRRYWFQVRLAAFSISIIVLPAFWHLARHIQNKHDYNRWVPFMSWLPILSFVIIRNSSWHARNFHSSIFAWLGRHSLETFTLQFHIWLAADTKGLLALGIFSEKSEYMNGRLLDFVLLTVIFLWVCWHITAATTSITAWIIDPSAWKEEIVMQEAGSESMRLRSGSFALLDASLKNGVSPMKLKGKLQKLVREDLRVRLVIMLGFLWFLNISIGVLMNVADCFKPDLIV